MNYSIVDLVNNQRNSVQPQTQQNNPQLQQIKQMMVQIKNSVNPQQAFQDLLQNPNISGMINMFQSKGFTAQQFAQLLANQQGVNLNALLQELMSV